MTLKHNHDDYPEYPEAAPVKEIGQYTAELWLSAGTITVSERGEENTYYLDQFGNRFFCKSNCQELADVILDQLAELIPSQ